ncbi:MAG: phosphoribosylanthranilate isomerase [Acetatifactor sp.]
MKIKICGLRREEDVDYANQVMPDYVGFILAEGFRRQISREQARSLKQRLSDKIQAVGVFVNNPIEEVISYLEEGIIDMAQLHGEETEEDIQYIQAVAAKPVIKAVKAQNQYIVEAWLDSSADYLLFDSGTGTGKSFDWSLLADVNREYFLAGGLNPGNIEEAMKQLSPYSIDISSGVETEGVKDLEKMQAAVNVVRGLNKG